MAEEITLLQMPVGVSTWNDLRQGGFFFVDKTALLPKLFKLGTRLFLTRPRRMGKTLLCSMLQEWFTNGSKSFAGLAIDGKLQEEGGYPVINLSFFELGKNVDAAEFEADLCARLIDAYDAAGFKVIDCYGITSFNELYLHLNKLARERGKQLVFLIDEWDYPLSSNLYQPEVFAAFQKVLRKFYGWLRLQPSVKFILITGIMRYRETSLFTGRDIRDISMEPVVANLLGYTQADLNGKQFAPYIDGAAKELGMTPSAVHAKLKTYYDGFCFDKDATVKVYCPFSVNMFFSALDIGSKPEFAYYWMDSSGASAALIAYLRNHQLSSQRIMELGGQNLVMPTDSLQEVSYLQDVTFEQILVLGGYFSIKAIKGGSAKAGNAQKREYRCGVTNKEVKDRLFPVLMSYVVSFKNKEGSVLAQALDAVKDDLRQGDIAQLCLSFNKILEYVRYDAYKAMEARDNEGKSSDKPQGQSKEEAQEAQDQGEEQPLNQVPKPEPEAFYRTMLMLALTSEDISTKEEVANNLGRSDLEATTEDQAYIFELKRLESTTESSMDKRLDDGEKQILERMYGNNHPQPELPQTMVVLVISDTYRQICAWSIFKVKRIAQELVVVERHKERVAISLQEYEHQQGLLPPPSSLSTKASAPKSKEQTPKSPRGRGAKASAPEAKEQAPKSPRGRGAKASAPEAKEQAPKSPRGRGAKASAPEAKEQAPKSPRGRGAKASAPESKEQAPKSTRSRSAKASASESKEQTPKSPRGRSAKAKAPEAKEQASKSPRGRGAKAKAAKAKD